MHIRTEISQELQARQAGATEQMHFHQNSKAIIKPLNKSHWSVDIHLIYQSLFGGKTDTGSDERVTFCVRALFSPYILQIQAQMFIRLWTITCLKYFEEIMEMKIPPVYLQKEKQRLGTSFKHLKMKSTTLKTTRSNF